MAHPITTYRKESGQTLSDLAALFGIQPPALWKWERKRVPAERVLEIERVTGIPRHELRPDLYPPPAEGQAA